MTQNVIIIVTMNIYKNNICKKEKFYLLFGNNGAVTAICPKTDERLLSMM